MFKKGVNKLAMLKRCNVKISISAWHCQIKLLDFTVLGGMDEMFSYGGYTGKVFRVNLTDNKVSEEHLSGKLVEKHLGGRGFGAYFFNKEIKPGIDPLGQENKLIFSTGPLMGTGVPCAVKVNLTTKSPHTGIYLETMASGYFGPELKFAGCDVLIVEGRSEEPVYLCIKDGDVEIKKARNLWGMFTSTTQEFLRRELGDLRVQIACIGPSGERLVKFASIIASERRAFGRGGAGAVMGSKKLKAIAVRGTKRKIHVSNPERVKELSMKIGKILKSTPITAQDYPKYGTNMSTTVINEFGFYPTKNFQSGVFSGIKAVSEGKWRNEFVVKDVSCPGCPIRCGKISLVREGPLTGFVTEGPEYETTWALGAQCGNDRLDVIIAADSLCDMYGVDTITAGNTIGFAMECFEKGLLTKEDTDGIDLRFGNHHAILKAIHCMAIKQGKLGEMLSLGVRDLSSKLGHGTERFAIHVKGLELPAYDPRGVWGMGLTYATSNRGGCHLKSWTIGDEVIAQTVPRWTVKGKAKLVIRIQNMRAVFNSVGICLFATKGLTWKLIPEVLEAVTGIKYTSDELLGVGERIYTLERIAAVKCGVNKKDDTLPRRILEEPLPEGPAKGKYLSLENFNYMLNEYYRLRGWDENGIPKKETLKRLGITNV